MKRPTNISLTEIAQQCGVSIATVSRVMHNSPSVRKETADLVRRAIRQLQQASPSRRLRTLPVESRAGGIETVTVAFLGGGSFANLLPIFLEVLGGISAELQRMGLKMLLSEVGKPDALDNGVLRNQRPEASIVFVNRRDWDDQALARLGERIPAVWVMGASSGPTVIDHVVPDNLAIGKLAYEYLTSDRKCSRLAYVFLPVFSPTMGDVSAVRAISFLTAARAAGIENTVYAVGSPHEPTIRQLGGPAVVAPTTAELVARLSRELPRGTGLFLSTDQETALLYHTLAVSGAVPDRDFPVVSCDNETPTLAPLHPRPATIDFGARHIGEQAVRQLLRRVTDPVFPPLLIQLPPRLVKPGAAD